MEVKKMQNGIQKVRESFDKQNDRVSSLLSKVFQDLKSSRSDLNEFIQNLEAEVARLRKDRDGIRVLYEQLNQQVGSLTRVNSQQSALLASLDREKSLSTSIKTLRDNSSDAPPMEESLYSEIELLASALDEIKERNISLVKQLAERDEVNSKLLGEKLRSDFNAAQSKKEADIILQRAASIERSAASKIESLETTQKDILQELAATNVKVAEAELEVQKLKIDLSRTSDEHRSAANRLSKIAALDPTSRFEEATRELETALMEKRRLQDELEAYKKRIKNLAPSTSSVEEELEIYKKLMKCNSCHLRDKNAVITKCMHVFCKVCLDSRIETRQRKCPNCGETFGQSDVKPIYL